MGALIQNGTVLLARRSSRRKVHRDRWSLPGGHIEDGEDAETALRRELMEEIGVMPQRWQFAGKFASEGLPEASATFHVYRIDQWHGYPQLVDDEHTELRWFSLAAIEGEAELAPPQLGEMLANLVSRETGKPLRSLGGDDPAPAGS